jgi:hypothetical protein
MKLLIFSFVFMLIFQKISGQDSIRVVREYNNERPITKFDSILYDVKNTVFISLDEGFDDSLYVTVNSIPLLKGYLKSNQSIGYAGGFEIHFKDSSEIKNLKIKFVKANRYIQEKVNLRYKALQIRGLNPWMLVYSNHFSMRE